MARFRLVTMVNPKPEREGEMNAWYENHHVPDLLGVEGVVAAERWRVRDAVSPPDALCGYVNIFEIDAEDPAAVLAEIRRRSAAGEISRSDASQLVSMAIYEVIGGD